MSGPLEVVESLQFFTSIKGIISVSGVAVWSLDVGAGSIPFLTHTANYH